MAEWSRTSPLIDPSTKTNLCRRQRIELSLDGLLRDTDEGPPEVGRVRRCCQPRVWTCSRMGFINSGTAWPRCTNASHAACGATRAPRPWKSTPRTADEWRPPTRVVCDGLETEPATT